MSEPSATDWIGAVFERIAKNDPTLSPYAIKLAEDAERIFSAKGRDVLAEYAAKSWLGSPEK